MRDIEFRGQHLHSDKWIIGQYLKREFSGHTDYSIWTPKRTIPVKPESIGQYTGLKDKNVNMIFEGDKVKTFGSIYEVIFNDGSFYLRKENIHHRLSRTIQDLEIIGNIHEEN